MMTFSEVDKVILKPGGYPVILPPVEHIIGWKNKHKKDTFAGQVLCKADIQWLLSRNRSEDYFQHPKYLINIKPKPILHVIVDLNPNLLATISTEELSSYFKVTVAKAGFDINRPFVNLGGRGGVKNYYQVAHEGRDYDKERLDEYERLSGHGIFSGR